MIYFMQPADGGPVKIGFSGNPEARRRELEMYYRRPLVLLATMPGGRAEEAEIHQRFAHLRLRRTEQFRPAADLMEFIERPLLVSADPNAVEAMTRASGSKTIPVRLDLDAEDHQMLRVVAAQNGKPMAVFAREVVLQLVRERYKRRGAK